MSFLNISTVVVPIDFSGQGAHAVSEALSLVDDPSAVHLVHVMLPGAHMSYGDYGAAWTSPVDDSVREKAIQEHFARYMADNNWPGMDWTIRMGDPGSEIVDYANELKADLIVIPSHGYHGFKRLLLGSVAERVIRLASCSVLVLRREDAE
ncbi:MAG: universal stress protein [Xanthomonadales bacterium]|nr:universal stress protein [Xanthomonadales bacterium]